MRGTLNALSIGFVSLMAFVIVGLTAAYSLEIHRPMQGGWNSYRAAEFAPQIAPYVLILICLLITRSRRAPAWIRGAGWALLLAAAAYLFLVLVLFSVQLHHLATMGVAFLLVALVGAHIAHLREVWRFQNAF